MTAPILTATLTGAVDLANADPNTITIKAMAHGLAKLDRFTGALERPFSLAQHSVLVRDLFRIRYPQLASEGAVHALLHDAHEYLFGDLTAPAQRMLEWLSPGIGERVNHAKALLDGPIREALRLTAPSHAIKAAINDCDQIAAATEWQVFMPEANGPNPFGVKPAKGFKPKALSWPDAAALFETQLALELDRWRSNRRTVE